MRTITGFSSGWLPLAANQLELDFSNRSKRSWYWALSTPSGSDGGSTSARTVCVAFGATAAPSGMSALAVICGAGLAGSGLTQR